jgi:hypothetical protein
MSETLEPKKAGAKKRMWSRRRMTWAIKKHFPEILEALLKDVHSNNPSVRVAAARALLDKILPSIKTAELTGKGGSKIKIEIVDYGSDVKDQSTA